MMGTHQAQPEFFSYRVNLEHRVRKDHPLRRVATALDFTIVRAEVARFYGRNGNEGSIPSSWPSSCSCSSLMTYPVNAN